MNRFSWKNIINLGVSSDLAYIQQNKIRIANIINLFFLFFAFSLMILALLQNYPNRTFVNLVAVLNSIILLGLNYFRYHKVVFHLIIFSTLTICTVFIVFFLNFHLIYYLILMLITVFIFFENKWIIGVWTLLIILDIMMLNYWIFSNKAHLYQASENFRYITVFLAMSIIVLSIGYFKIAQQRFQKSILRRNDLLAQQKEEIHTQAESLKKSNNTKEKLLSIISHDLKTPIHHLQAILELLDNQNLSKEEFQNIVLQIRNETDNLSFTMDNLLKWSINQMEGFQTKPIDFNIAKQIDDKIKFYQKTALSKRIQIINKVSYDSLVKADPDQIDVVLRNLISNALKYSHEGSHIFITSKRENSHLEISVQDEGVGIPENILQNIFNPPTNCTTRGTKGEKGTGLGLILSKEMIEKNQGKLWAQSKLHEGSCFVFTLPSSLGKK